LKYSLFIARRLQQGKQGSFSSLVSRVAVITIMLGVATMVVSFSILEGFKKNIKEKIFSFGAHVQVTKYEIDQSFEDSPITLDSLFLKQLNLNPEIAHVQVYLHKPGLLKSESEISGVILKGITHDFDTTSFRTNMKEGRFIKFKSDSSYSPEIIISTRLASKLNVKKNDSLWMYFIQDPPRFRKLCVVGIYETGLEEFDDHFVLSDLALNRKMNDWGDTLIGGYEIFIKDFDQIDPVSQEVFDMTDADLDAVKITDKYQEIFDWLVVLNQNVMFFIIIVLFVACFNTISTVFILIVERTSTIGLLKAMGASNGQLRMIFFIQGCSLLGKGLLWGNILGLGIAWLQYQFHLIPLDPVNYYMYTVPISWNWWMIGLVNLLTIGLVGLVILIPLASVTYMKTIKAIKFN
jgi:lipoprotein-releasing system permease protein